MTHSIYIAITLQAKAHTHPVNFTAHKHAYWTHQICLLFKQFRTVKPVFFSRLALQFCLSAIYQLFILQNHKQGSSCAVRFIAPFSPLQPTTPSAVCWTGGSPSKATIKIARPT